MDAVTILHGTDDTLIPLRQSATLAAAMRRAGTPVQLTPIPNAGHNDVLIYGWSTAIISDWVASLF